MLYYVLDKPNSPPVLPAHPPLLQTMYKHAFPPLSAHLVSPQASGVTKSFSARCNFPRIITTPSIKS